MTRKLLVVECLNDIEAGVVEATVKSYSGVLGVHDLPVLPPDTLRYLRDSLAGGELVIAVHRNDLQLLLAALDAHALLRA